MVTRFSKTWGWIDGAFHNAYVLTTSGVVINPFSVRNGVKTWLLEPGRYVIGAPFPLMPVSLITLHPSSGLSPHPRGVTSQCPRGWVLDHPPSQCSTQAGGQYSLKVPAYMFFAYF